MTSSRRDLLADVPGRLEPLLRSYLEGAVPANIAAMRLFIEGQSPEEIDTAVSTATAALGEEGRGEAQNRLMFLQDLLRTHRSAFATVKDVMKEAEHARPPGPEPDSVAHWAGVFDRLARNHPEAGVALYALGSPALLQAATEEIAVALDRLGLIGPDYQVLDLGCGIGRFVQALAPKVATITGIDVSGEMVRHARHRCSGLPNVALQQSNGRDLAPFPDERFDLVLAVDVFPYLVGSGGALASRHVQECGRVLKPGGVLAIFNYSYRGDPVLDRADLQRCADEGGFGSVVLPELSLKLWDGSSYLLAKAAD